LVADASHFVAQSGRRADGELAPARLIIVAGLEDGVIALLLPWRTGHRHAAASLRAAMAGRRAGFEREPPVARRIAELELGHLAASFPRRAFRHPACAGFCVAQRLGRADRRVVPAVALEVARLQHVPNALHVARCAERGFRDRKIPDQDLAARRERKESEHVCDERKAPHFSASDGHRPAPDVGTSLGCILPPGNTSRRTFSPLRASIEPRLPRVNRDERQPRLPE
jgi:hypothetical protein